MRRNCLQQHSVELSRVEVKRASGNHCEYWYFLKMFDITVLGQSILDIFSALEMTGNSLSPAQREH